MKKLFIMFSVTIIVFSMIFLLFRFFLQKNDTAFPVFHVAQDAEVKKEENSDFAAPLDRAAERVTKKPFGIFISLAVRLSSRKDLRDITLGRILKFFPRNRIPMFL